MGNSVLSADHFHNEEAAFAFVEQRVWPTGPVCPHCGCFGRIGKLKGKSTRMGVYKCYDCRKPFTVRIGTIFEDSHLPLRLWLQAILLIAASKKGISSNQLHRVLGVTLKTAWFMSHRVRLAMAVQHKGLMGGDGGTVEADETYIRRRKGMKKRSGANHKEAIFALVERKSSTTKGQVRSFHIGRVTGENLREALETHVAKEAHLKTDDARWYRKIAAQFASHEVVNHTSKEYVRDFVHHTNTIEGVFSVFKRGMIGVYQHCDGEHLHRYLSEFDFRYNTRVSLKVDDKMRADKILTGTTGKRLTYKELSRSQEVLTQSEDGA